MTLLVISDVLWFCGFRYWMGAVGRVVRAESESLLQVGVHRLMSNPACRIQSVARSRVFGEVCKLPGDPVLLQVLTLSIKKSMAGFRQICGRI
jgi:hypothetical protein